MHIPRSGYVACTHSYMYSSVNNLDATYAAKVRRENKLNYRSCTNANKNKCTIVLTTMLRWRNKRDVRRAVLGVAGAIVLP